MRYRFYLLLIVFSLLVSMKPLPTASALTMAVNGNCTLTDAIFVANNDTSVGNCPAGSGVDVGND